MSKKTGKRRSAAPYTKSNKTPFEYSAQYAEWFRKVTGKFKRYNMSSFKT